jgi:hypothetical protein
MSARRPRNRRRIARWIIASAIGISLTASVPVAWPKASEPVYSGTLQADSTATVRFRVVTKRDFDFVRFSVAQVPLTCDDGVVRRMSRSGVRIPMISDNRFIGELYSIGASGDFVFEVNGRVQGDRARGRLLVISDPDDELETHFPDCGTLGKMPWTAKRK